MYGQIHNRLSNIAFHSAFSVYQCANCRCSTFLTSPDMPVWLYDTLWYAIYMPHIEDRNGMTSAQIVSHANTDRSPIPA